MGDFRSGPHQGPLERRAAILIKSASGNITEKPAGRNRRAELSRPTKPFCRPDEAIRKQSSVLIPSRSNNGMRSCYPSFSMRFTATSFSPPFPAFQAREQGYDRSRHGVGYIFQHEHFPGSRIRRVSDALMGRSALPSTDRSIVWLADLIEATEVVAASAQPCDPAIVKAFSHRLEKRADVRPLFGPAPMGTIKRETRVV
jgi:hypothetical protein